MQFDLLCEFSRVGFDVLRLLFPLLLRRTLLFGRLPSRRDQTSNRQRPVASPYLVVMYQGCCTADYQQRQRAGGQQRRWPKLAKWKEHKSDDAVEIKGVAYPDEVSVQQSEDDQPERAAIVNAPRPEAAAFSRTLRQ